MAHEVVPCSPKICDWALNLFRLRFGLQSRKNVRATMEFEVSKRSTFNLHYPLHWSNGVCGEKGKRGSLIAKVRGPWQTNVVIFVVFGFWFC